MAIDFTHDATARSWEASANYLGTDFPLQNLPYCVFRRRGSDETFRGGSGLGSYIIDLGALHRSGVLHGEALEAALAASHSTLNQLLSLGPSAWSALRHALFKAFRDDADGQTLDAAANCLVRQQDVEYGLPVRITVYTDYFTSIYHAIAGGRLLDPDYELSRTFQFLPMAYHGRASSIGVAGQQVRRPHGQMLDAHNEPVFRPTRKLDFELELGVVIGQGNRQGEPIPIKSAEQHVFGLCLLNDWSARDIQAWEMTPLGPFQSKNFATTLSPWIVTLSALEPFRTGLRRDVVGPELLPYLDSAAVRSREAFDIHLQISLETECARAAGAAPDVICTTNFVHQYWTISQMVAHHTAGGCNLRIGDLLGTGTVSGPAAASAGALIELSGGGKTPVRLLGGETRSFVEDGDTIIFHGWCQIDGYRRIGFGANSGRVVPSADIGSKGIT